MSILVTFFTALHYALATLASLMWRVMGRKDKDIELGYRVCDEALDPMEVPEARVVYRRLLGGYEHEAIAAELDIPVEQARQIAKQGLEKIRHTVLPPNNFPRSDYP